MRIIANGSPYDVDAGTTVAEFIRSRALDPRFVVVERNGEPLERERYDEVRPGRGRPAGAGARGGGRVSAGGELGERRRERLDRGAACTWSPAPGSAQGDLAAFLEAILDAGADIVQLREKDAEAGDLLRWG